MSVWTGLGVPQLDSSDPWGMCRGVAVGMKIRHNPEFGDYLCAAMMRAPDGIWFFAENLAEFTDQNIADAGGPERFLLDRIIPAFKNWAALAFKATDGKASSSSPALGFALADLITAHLRFAVDERGDLIILFRGEAK